MWDKFHVTITLNNSLLVCFSEYVVCNYNLVVIRYIYSRFLAANQTFLFKAYIGIQISKNWNPILSSTHKICNYLKKSIFRIIDKNVYQQSCTRNKTNLFEHSMWVYRILIFSVLKVVLWYFLCLLQLLFSKFGIIWFTFLIYTLLRSINFWLHTILAHLDDIR